MVMRFILLVVKQYAMSKKLIFNFLLFYLDIRLLDDIQRLNLKTLKWEHVATLMSPIAAWSD
jgi:hypothetical protein